MISEGALSPKVKVVPYIRGFLLAITSVAAIASLFRCVPCEQLSNGLTFILPLRVLASLSAVVACYLAFRVSGKSSVRTLLLVGMVSFFPVSLVVTQALHSAPCIVCQTFWVSLFVAFLLEETTFIKNIFTVAIALTSVVGFISLRGTTNDVDQRQIMVRDTVAKIGLLEDPKLHVKKVGARVATPEPNGVFVVVTNCSDCTRKNILTSIAPQIKAGEEVTLVAPSQDSARRAESYIKAQATLVDPALIFEFGVPPSGTPYCFWVRDNVIQRRIP